MNPRWVELGILSQQRLLVRGLTDDDVVLVAVACAEPQGAIFSRVGHLNQLGGDWEVTAHEQVDIPFGVADLGVGGHGSEATK